jgi:Uma2 family endonuclease
MGERDVSPHEWTGYDPPMTALANTHITVDEYLAWAEAHPGRYELVNGTVFAMSPESVGHAETKAAVYDALLAGIRACRLPCHVLPDGITVRVDDATAYEPDSLVYCGARLPPSSVEVPNPVIVVEVLSPSTRHVDLSLKLAGYFRLPSVAHYLIVDPGQRLVIHHARGDAGAIATRIVSEGRLRLDPPGMDVTVEEMFPAS